MITFITDSFSHGLNENTTLAGGAFGLLGVGGGPDGNRTRIIWVIILMGCHYSPARGYTRPEIKQKLPNLN